MVNEIEPPRRRDAKVRQKGDEIEIKIRLGALGVLAVTSIFGVSDRVDEVGVD